jgi:L-ascorbate metabolism protein UlaG (beta-lactamase superfamily)
MVLLNYNGKKILTDPSFSSKGSMSPVECAENETWNPLVNLTMSIEELSSVDAIMITHIHRDHFDEEAQKQLPKNITVFCQPDDYTNIVEMGFEKVIKIEDSYKWEGITLIRTEGKHGRGAVGKLMGKVSGFVLTAKMETSLYISGDTIWCKDVKHALNKYKPDISLCYAGAARLLKGKPITMTFGDLKSVCKHAPYTTVIAIHMDAWNHCELTREKLKALINKSSYEEDIIIPQDGETLSYDKMNFISKFFE